MKKQKILLSLLLLTLWACNEKKKSTQKIVVQHTEKKDTVNYFVKDNHTDTIKQDAIVIEKEIIHEVSEQKQVVYKNPLKNLNQFKKTDFLPTLENTINKNNNSIYCVTLLYAWNEIKKQLKDSLEIHEKFTDLNLLNNSSSFINVLKENEYSIESKISGDTIIAKASFDKSLPFDIPLESFDNRLIFDNQKVRSFGIMGHSSYRKKEIVNIIYYKDDNNFIVSLQPKNQHHEIILFKSKKTLSSISKMHKEIVKLSIIGKKEKQERNRNYYFLDGDKLIIPKVNFNIENNYNTLERTSFNTQHQHFTILKAWQRTAFMLNEKGAEIESQSDIHASHSHVSNTKNMIFDKPFLVLLKRKNAQFPYFGAWITNTELMIKE